MKKNLFLLLLPLLAACGKDAPKPAQDISGDYNTTVHYLNTWAVSQTEHGITLDTNYTSPFHITYAGDTINVSYTDFDGSTATGRLVYLSAQSVPDTLRFAGPWNGYSYTTTYFTFYKNANQFKYTRHEHTNPSGGGTDIDYTIQSQ